MAEIDPLAFQRGFQSSQSMFDSQRKNKLQDLLMGQKEREIAQENALASIIGNQQNYDTAGNLKREALPQIAQASPSQYGAFRQQIAQQDSAAQAAQKAKREDLMGWIKFSQERMANVNSPESWTAFKQEASQVYPEYAGRLPDQYDPAQIANAQRNAVPFLEQLKLNQQQAQFNANQQNAAANREVTMRGQDMNDKRARESNAIQADIKRLQLAEAEYKAREKDQSKQAAISSAEDSLAILDKALNHPGRETATGVSGVADPRNYWPGSNARNFQVVLDQIKGQAFLQAFQSLKGGGQITEVEGKKATDAIGRLDRAQSDEEFKVALQDLRGVMQRGYDRLKGTQSSGQAGSSGAKKIGSKAEYDAMPSGTLFVAPDGTTRRKP